MCVNANNENSQPKQFFQSPIIYWWETVWTLNVFYHQVLTRSL